MRSIPFILLFLAPVYSWADDPLDPIDRALAVQKAMADAKDLLTAGDSPSAAKRLEEQLPNANVNRTFLDLLRKAYVGELAKLRAMPTPNAKRIDTINKRLAILDGQPAPAIQPVPREEMKVSSLVKDAVQLFHEGKQDPTRYQQAAIQFAKAETAGELLTADQKAAWAYCKLKNTTDEVNRSNANPAILQAAASEARSAIALAPTHPGVQQAGAHVLSAIAPTTNDWQTISGDGFQIRYRGPPELAKAILASASTHRQSISTKWFGPAGPAWSPVCDIIIHPTSREFASATKLNPEATGHAEVTLDQSRVASRRIDLRADDPAIQDVTLPRELSHIVLADLFPVKAPPRWAEEGMAILAAGPTEVARYKRAMPRLVADGQMPTAAEILQSTGFPSAEKITGFYVGSVALTDYLVSLNGEKGFAAFLTDSQRYGIETALRRQYHLTPAQLDSVWSKRR